MLIYLLEVFQEWGSRRGVYGGYLGLLTDDFEDMVISVIMDDPHRRFPETLVLIFLLEVCNEAGGKKGGYLEDVLMVPSQRLGGHGDSCCHG